MPTLGEVAAFNRTLLGNLDIGSSYLRGVQAAQGRQALERARYELDQERFRDATDIATAGALSPIFEPTTIARNPEAGQQALDWINQQFEQAKARGLKDKDLFYLQQMKDIVLKNIGQSQMQGPPAPNELAAAGQRGALGAKQSIQEALSFRASQENQYKAGQPQIITGPDGRLVLARRTPDGYEFKPLIQDEPQAQERSPQSQQAPQRKTQAGKDATKFKYPVRGIEPFVPLPGEEQAHKTGIERREALESGANNLVNSKNELDLAQQKIAQIREEKWFKDYPETGILGSAKRALYKFLGDEDYIALEKSLERVSVETATALGANTNDARESVKTAMGANARSLDVIENVLQQEQGKLKHIELKNMARQKFSGGDRNYQAFEQDWNKNADAKIFEAMYLLEQKGGNAKLNQEKLEKLFGKPGSASYNEYLKKYQNIKKMVAQGSL